MSAASSQRGFRFTRLLSLAPISLLAMLGCASIIGLDEYTVAGNGGSAGSAGNAGMSVGGSAGRAGSSGSAGSGARAGNPGSAGSAGSAGMSEGGSPAEAGSSGAAGDLSSAGAGEAGAAGTTSTPPPVVGCDGTTPLVPNEQLVRSCLLRAGCDPSFDPVRNISTCVSKNTQAALPGESCNLSSTTCDDFAACEHVGIAHDDLCGGTKHTRCVGNVAINCGNYSVDSFYDCNGLGGTCATYTYSDPDQTVYADCKLDITPDSCLGYSDGNQYYCHTATGQDDLRYYCWQDEAYGSKCSLGSCQTDSSGQAGCYFDIPSCTGPATPTCSSSGVATVCSGLDSGPPGSLFKYNCATAGLSCTISAGSEYCLAPGCKAADVDSQCTESCSDDGSQLTFCYGGAPYTVSCADYGFTQCQTGTDSNSNPFAACRF